MKRSAFLVSPVVVILVLGSCASAPAPQAASSASKGTIEKTDIVGHWTGDWGDMYLKVVGSKVRGVYTHDDGRVIGIFANGEFKGWWSELPSREPPEDAGAAEFKFDRTGDALALDGRWKYGSDPSEDWGEDWDLTWVGAGIPPEIDALFSIDSDFPEK
jgi:hypothetical protein